MKQTTKEQALKLIESINARSMQKYELRIGGEKDMAQSWELYVSTRDGRNRCKIADGNFLLIGSLINTLAEIHHIAHSRIYF